MHNRIKHRIVILIALILSIFFFSNDFSLIDIEKTAIIVALGIDKSGDDIEITAQIGVPQATEQALVNDDTLISAKGKTVMNAIENLSKNSGWFPKLAFCNVIIIGKNLAYDDVSAITDNILASEHFQNSALLSVCDGDAKNFLSTPTPLDAISSFAIQKVLIENGAASSAVMDTTVKSFCESNHGRNACGYMPYLKIKNDALGQEDSSSATTSFYYDNTSDNGLIGGLLSNIPLAEGGKSGKSGGSGGGESDDSQKTPTAVFDASRTAIFKDGKIVDILSGDETIVYNLLHLSADRIVLPVVSEDEKAALEVFDSRHKISLNYGVKPQIIFNLSVTVRMLDESSDGKNNSLGRRATVPEDFLNSLEYSLTSTVNELAERMLCREIDLFGIRNMTYKYHHKNYEEYKKIPLKNFMVKTEISVNSHDGTK